MRFSVVLMQLILAAIVGYAAGRYAQDEAPRNALPPATVPGPAIPVPAPPAAAPAAVPPPATAENAMGAALSISFRSAVQRAAPSVLTVHSARSVARGPLGLGGRALLSEGLGSGVLIDGDGDVVTNNHVVAGANELAVSDRKSTRLNSSHDQISY